MLAYIGFEKGQARLEMTKNRRGKNIWYLPTGPHDVTTQKIISMSSTPSERQMPLVYICSRGTKVSIRYAKSQRRHSVQTADYSQGNVFLLLEKNVMKGA